MANEVKWKSPNSRTTGIASNVIASGANTLGSEIDNSTNKDRFLSITSNLQSAVAPTENTVMEYYILYAPDGTTYEDGGASVDPKKFPVALHPVKNLTTFQNLVFSKIPLEPFKFRILLKSELNQSTNAIVSAYTYNEDIQ